MPQENDGLLTTAEVAKLLRVHPKQVYRLMKRGLPCHRMGGEWRFSRADVLSWAGGVERPPAPSQATEAAAPPKERVSPALLAANGDLVVELLLSTLEQIGPPFVGFLRTDRARAVSYLQSGDVLLAGCHGEDIPARIGEERLARIHLVDREVGLATPKAKKLSSLTALSRLRLASRPHTAGVRAHLDIALKKEGLEPEFLHQKAQLLSSHEEVACAVARGEVDAGLVTLAWASRLGLGFFPIAVEPYGLLVKARDLGDPRVVRLCEVAQGVTYRGRLGLISGYNPRGVGDIRYDS